MKKQSKRGDYPLCERIQYLRKLRGFSKAELARKVGITPSALGHFENGRREPLISTLEKMAEALEIVPALFFRTENILVFDMDKLRQRYKKMERLPPGLHRDISVIYNYAKRIGFV